MRRGPRCGRFRDYSDSHIREPSLAVPENAGRDGSDARSCAAGDGGRRGSGDATCSMVANDENSTAGTCNSIVDGTVVLYIPHCRNTERPLAGLIVFGSCIAANIGGEKCERSIIPRPLRHFEVFEKHNQTLGISTGRDSNLGKNQSQLSLSLR